MQVIEQLQVQQSTIIQIQDLLSQGDDVIEGETEHYHAPGVYVRVLKIPANNYAVGKAHRTRHITMLIKGCATVTDANGITRVIEAPKVFVSEPGKKFVFCNTDCEFVNVHPTDTEDLEIIESNVIIPDDEYRHSIAMNKPLQVSAGE